MTLKPCFESLCKLQPDTELYVAQCVHVDSGVRSGADCTHLQEKPVKGAPLVQVGAAVIPLQRVSIAVWCVCASSDSLPALEYQGQRRAWKVNRSRFRCTKFPATLNI